jgi:hypothetical protein
VQPGLCRRLRGAAQAASTPASSQGHVGSRGPQGAISEQALLRLLLGNKELARRAFLAEPIQAPKLPQAAALRYYTARTYNRLCSAAMLEQQAQEDLRLRNEPAEQVGSRAARLLVSKCDSSASSACTQLQP